MKKIITTILLLSSLQAYSQEFLGLTKQASMNKMQAEQLDTVRIVWQQDIETRSDVLFYSNYVAITDDQKHFTKYYFKNDKCWLEEIYSDVEYRNYYTKLFDEMIKQKEGEDTWIKGDTKIQLEIFAFYVIIKITKIK